jgi:hypothetical protein
MDGYVYKIESVAEPIHHDGNFCIAIEYTILERIKSEDFYNKYYPETISVTAVDNDCGDYEIGDYTYCDVSKANLRDIDLYESIIYFDKIQNRSDNIDDIIK